MVRLYKFLSICEERIATLRFAGFWHQSVTCLKVWVWLWIGNWQAQFLSSGMWESPSSIDRAWVRVHIGPSVGSEYLHPTSLLWYFHCCKFYLVNTHYVLYYSISCLYQIRYNWWTPTKSPVNSIAFDANFWPHFNAVYVFRDQFFLELIHSCTPPGWDEFVYEPRGRHCTTETWVWPEAALYASWNCS